MRQLGQLGIVLLAAAACCGLAVDLRADLIINSGTMESPYVIDSAQDVSQTASPYYFRVATTGDAVVSIECDGSVYNSAAGGGTKIGSGPSSDGILIVDSGGSLYTSDERRIIKVGVSGGIGDLVVTGGTVYASQIDLGEGGSVSQDSDGAVGITSGTIAVSGTFRLGLLSSGYIGAGSATQTGGTVTLGGDLRVNYANGTHTCTYTISGGALSQTGSSADMWVGTSSSDGVFHVDGSGATSITVADRIYGDADHTTLKFTVDSGGVTPISVNYTWSYLNGTVDMELAQGVTPQVDETFDLITTRTGTLTSSLTLADGDDELWQLQVVNDDTLQAKYLGPSDPPVADAGSDQAVEDSDDNGSQSVTLDGSGSSDDGGIVSYVWKDAEGTQIATGETANVTLDVGLNDITLVVTDAESQSDSAVVRIWVYPGVDYWVDQNHPSASNGNDGTSESTPWLTVDYAVDHASAGDVIMVKEGIYREYVSTGVSGSSGSPITLMGKPFDRVVISGADEITGWTQCTSQIAKGNANYASIYYADIAWEPTRLSQDGDTDLTFGREPDSGWWVCTGASSTTLTDTTNLTGADDYWNGGKVFLNMGSIQTRTITDYVSATQTLTVDSSWSAETGDLYYLMGMVQLIDGAGEWAVEDIGGGNYRVYCWPYGGGDPDSYLMEGSRRPWYCINFASQSYWVFDNLEARHCTGHGIGNGNSGGNGHVIVRNCWAHHNDNYGMKAVYADNVEFRRNVATYNRWGMSVACSDDVVIEDNEIGWNWEDGLRITGSSSAGPAANPVMRRNCIVHHRWWNHADGFQSFNGLTDLLAEDNLILASGQGFYVEGWEGATLRNNMVIGSCNTLVGLGAGTTNDTTMENNTLGYTRGSVVVHSTGCEEFDYANNIFYKGNHEVALANVYEGTGFVSDYNMFYHGPGLSAYDICEWNDVWYTLAEFQTYSGEEEHSTYDDPEFVNAPAYLVGLNYTIGTLEDFTPTRVYTWSTSDTSRFSVGDYVEIDWDGVVRTVTAVSTANKYVEFTPALPTPLTKVSQMANWLDNDDFTLDLSLAEGSPCIGAGSGGSDIGSTINVQQYLAGDLNGDGRRDFPWPSDE